MWANSSSPSTTLGSRGAVIASHYTYKETEALERVHKLFSSEGWEALVAESNSRKQSPFFTQQHSAHPAGAHCSPSQPEVDSFHHPQAPQLTALVPWTASTRPLYTTQAPFALCPPVSSILALHTVSCPPLNRSPLWLPTGLNGNSLNFLAQHSEPKIRLQLNFEHPPFNAPSPQGERSYHVFSFWICSCFLGYSLHVQLSSPRLHWSLHLYGSAPFISSHLSP